MACYLLLTLHDQNTPWLIRAGYYLGEVYLARLVRPGSEKPFTHKVTYFSRLFLSNCLGGSQYPTYTKVTLDRNHVYHLADYYVGKLEWNSQYPKKVGENGALLLVGRNFANPPVPWGLTEGTLFVGHRATPIPINCFIKRDSAEYEYLGCYVIHNEFRKLTDNEVEKNVPKATQELWEHGINSTQWGAKLKYKSESRKADELFKLEDDEPSKLCYYWQYLEYIGYNKCLYDALCEKGEQIGWTTRKKRVSDGSGVTEGIEESAAEKGDCDTPPTSSDEDNLSPSEE